MRLSRTITRLNRAELVRAVEAAPLGAQLELVDDPRTLAQNRTMWLLLHAFAEQVEHFGRRYDASSWKAIFLRALGKELVFAPSLDGEHVVAIGYSSSKLSKEEMSDLIELLFSEGAKRGVDFDAPRGVARPARALHGPARPGEAAHSVARQGADL